MKLIPSMLLVFGLATAAASAQTDQWPGVFDPLQVVTIHLSMDSNDWEVVKADATLSIEKSALMWAEGETNQLLIEVKRKSDPAIGPKVSLKLDVNAFVPGQEWRGLRKLSLENGNGGNSVVKEGFAHYLHRLAWRHGFYEYNPGFASWVKLFVNGEYIGVYVHAEERDKQFLKNRGMWQEGATWLYKNDPNPVLETGAAGNSPTHGFLCFLPFRNNCPQPNLESNLPPMIDMQGMLTLGAIEAFTANNDGLFTHNGKNVFFADYMATNFLKRLYFPWDLDAGLGNNSVNASITGFSGNYSTQILNHYWFRRWYFHIMSDLLDAPLSAASLSQFLDELEPVLTPPLDADVNNGLDGSVADEFAALRSWVTNRINNVRGQIGAIIGPPRFSQTGGEIVPGFQLELSHTNLAGTVYYTTDGSDPRGFAGTIAGIGATNGVPVVLTNTTHIIARVLSGTNWSALRQATFNVAHANDSLKLTEIMYHPHAASTNEDGDDYEFVELRNTGVSNLNLSGCSFDGINFRFRPNTIIAPGAFVLLIRNPLTFSNRNPSIPFHGIYFGGLENSGEKLRLRNSDGNNIISAEYDDDPPWPIGADGFGYSLVNANPAGDPDRPENWRASAGQNGSPGTDDPLPPYGFPVVVNEVVTHTDPPLEDAIELFNATTNAVDVGGWFLSDQINNDDPTGVLLKKFRIPDGTIVPAGGYRVIYESDFNADTNNPSSFALSQYGDEVFLTSSDAAGNLTGYITGMRFGAADNGVAFGRFQTSAGTDFTAMQTRTFGMDSPATVEEFRTGGGATNSGPRVGPIVFSEIMYHPPPGGNEFIELRNLAETNIDVGGWTLNGAGAFVFPPGSLIESNGLVVLIGTTNITVEQFRLANNVPPQVPVFAHAFELQNDGERLELRKPADSPTNAGVVVDWVRYNDKSPWPTEADGEGPSLEKVPPWSHGNDPLNWRSLKHGGSPGTTGSLSTVIAIITNSSWRYHGLSYNLGVAWRTQIYSDSGWPSGDGILGYGDLSVATTISNAPGIAVRPVTTYFRKEFTIPDEPSAIDQLVLSVNYDDGFIAYINGQEIARRSMPAGETTFNSLATPHSAGSYETIDLADERHTLVRGRNVLAVELHQSTTNDSVLVWDAQLTYTTAIVPGTTPVEITRVEKLPGGLLIEWTSVVGRSYQVQFSDDFVAWTDLGPVITAETEIAQHIDSAAPTVAPRRFYKIRVVED